MATDSGHLPLDTYVQSHQPTSQYHIYQQSQQPPPPPQQQSLGVVNASDATVGLHDSTFVILLHLLEFYRGY